ncbi:MAG TPA: molecular chaperone TorD family protein [Usitatibacter sp.]|nr:molecular chaperone TorD family protein [Usitatibacter sp.]
MDTIPDWEREDAAELLEEYSARANLCRLFAGAFAEEPSAAYVAAIRAPAARAALAAMGARFDEDFEAPTDSELAEALACEWTTLFAAPGGCTPIESVRMTGRMQQEPFHAVREAYRRAGFKVSPGRFSVVDDQLGVELLFAASLLDRMRAAAERHDLLLQDRTLKELQRFWALHLGRWVRGYASLVERATMHSFFRELARLLREFAGEEIEALHVRVDDIDGGRLEVPKSEVAIDVDPDEPECNACVARSASASPAIAPIVLHR